MRLEDGRSWYTRAYDALEEGRVAAAVSAFRRAVATDRGNRRYQLALATALVSGGRHGEAREVLQALRAAHPDDPETSLQLARLEASERRWDEAFQHYQNTVTALWSADQIEARQYVRTEMIELLLQQGLASRALSELLVLGSSLPDEPAARVRVGRMFLRAGDAQRARQLFGSVLEAEPRNLQALVGAGEAAFALGDYADARRLLADVPETDPAARLRTVADLVLTADPLAPRLALAERRRRAARVLAHAGSVLERCLPAEGPSGAEAAPAPLQEEHEAISASFDQPAGISREVVEQAFDVAYRIERRSGAACPEPEPLSEAILLIGRRHELDAP